MIIKKNENIAFVSAILFILLVTGQSICSTSVLESVETLIVQLNDYTDTGIAYIAIALISNNTLTHTDKTLNKIGECVGRITPKKLKLWSFSPSLQSEEAVKEWIQSVVIGGNSLIRPLEHNQDIDLVIIINISFRFNTDDLKTQLDSSLQKTMGNLRRVKTFH